MQQCSFHIALRYILNVIRLCESHELHMTFGPPPPYGLQLLQFSVLNIYHHVTFTAGMHAILQNFYHLCRKTNNELKIEMIFLPCKFTIIICSMMTVQFSMFKSINYVSIKTILNYLYLSCVNTTSLLLQQHSQHPSD